MVPGGLTKLSHKEEWITETDSGDGDGGGRWMVEAGAGPVYKLIQYMN